MFASIGMVSLDTSIGSVEFHVVPCNIPFLLGLKDMDRLNCTVNTLQNTIMKNGKVAANLIRKYGHIWMTLGHIQSLFIYTEDESPTCYFTEQQLRTIHRRFGHPSATRLWKILRRAGHQTELKLIERLTKFCRDCQLSGNKPLHFKFSLRQDKEFNHTIYVDILWLEDGPAVHVVDDATSFSAAEWPKGAERESAEEVWNAIQRC